MVWDPVWEEIFSEREKWGKYPPEEFIRFIFKHLLPGKNPAEIEILELGCGPATGVIRTCIAEGIKYTGIDKSHTAIERTQKFITDSKIASQMYNLLECELTEILQVDRFFDAIVDIATLQHNSVLETKAIIENLYVVLKPNGLIFSIQASNQTSGEKCGKQIDDYTNTEYKSGVFAKMGKTRLSDLNLIKDLFANFEILSLEIINTTNVVSGEKIENYVIVARKRARNV